jgi:hypothetical protein
MVNKYRQHAIKRMFEREITEVDIDSVLSNGRVIEDYLNDYPLPSCLWLGYIGNRPLHIVFADNHQLGERIIITVYEPNPAQWSTDFTTRVKS